MIISLRHDSILSCVGYSTHVNNLTSNFVSLQEGTAVMVRMVLKVHQAYLENQEYQATLDCLVLGLLVGKLGLLVRTVHLANLGQKVLNFDYFCLVLLL